MSRSKSHLSRSYTKSYFPERLSLLSNFLHPLLSHEKFKWTCQSNVFLVSAFSSGIEGNPTVFYRLIRGSTAQTNKYDTFYLQQRQQGGFTWADIKVNHPLDFETNKEYNLTIRVEVCALLRLHWLRYLELDSAECA